MLRKTNTRIPVQLFVLDVSEYNVQVCETILPSLNAECVRLDLLIGEEGAKRIGKGYQIKAFAVLFSKFEEVLFLDADAFVLRDPEDLFGRLGQPSSGPSSGSADEEQGKKAGLLLWPDFWASSQSPLFSTIISTNTTERSNEQQKYLLEHPSSESGQLLISKRSPSQSLALLMTVYYNFHGVGYYYPLLSQGGPGEGDKETWAAGVEAVNLHLSSPSSSSTSNSQGRQEFTAASYTMFTKRPVDTIGYYEDGYDALPADESGNAQFKGKGQYHGVAMLQYAPASSDPIANPTAAGKDANEREEEFTPMYLHHNYPKPNPSILLFSAPLSSSSITQQDPSFGAACVSFASVASPASASATTPSAEAAAAAGGTIGNPRKQQVKCTAHRRLWGPEALTRQRFSGSKDSTSSSSSSSNGNKVDEKDSSEDVEKEMWIEMRGVACEYDFAFTSAAAPVRGKGVGDISNSKSEETETCRRVKAYMSEMFGTKDTDM
ncbi:hypothetical protein AAFC00_007056 [Neodothiora populina]|uniref:Nucleotide-diphospho-sugar transferase n=1 Tax=Neodothiora populina TaxID=2781224 RepID=A0ABR3PC28_9PEZI